MHIITCNAPAKVEQVVVSYNKENQELEFWSKHEGYSVLAGRRFIGELPDSRIAKLVEDACKDYFNIGFRRAREEVKAYLFMGE